MSEELEIQRWDESEPPNRKKMREELLDEGFHGIHTFRDAPGTTYAEHQHDYIEVRWVLKGELIFGVGGKEYHLKPGDRIDMPAHLLHDAKVDPSKGAAYVCASK